MVSQKGDYALGNNPALFRGDGNVSQEALSTSNPWSGGYRVLPLLEGATAHEINGELGRY